MNRKSSIFITIIGLQVASLSGQVILSPDERTDVLDGMQSVLENAAQPMTSVGENASPFHVTERKVPVAVVRNDVPVNEVQEPTQELQTALSDSVALGIISQQFKPLGSLVLGNRGFLQLPKGRTIEKGQKFKADIRGFSYDVLISDITQKGYTLELGTAQSHHSFVKAGGTQ